MSDKKLLELMGTSVNALQREYECEVTNGYTFGKLNDGFSLKLFDVSLSSKEDDFPNEDLCECNICKL